jgi:hypothetical protein
MTRVISMGLLIMSTVACEDDPVTDSGVDSGVDTGPLVIDTGTVDDTGTVMDSSAGDTSSGDASSDSAGGDADAGLTRLTLIDDGVCPEEAHIFASPGEHGHWYAAVFVPPAHPFTVTNIEYPLNNSDEGCDASTEHLVQVYTVTDTTVPPADPTVIHELTVAEPASADPSVLVTQTLPTPVVLTAGQNIVVAVEMRELGADGVCVVSCFPGEHDDQVYWSNAADPPYAWTTLVSFELDTAPRIEALGILGE